MGKFIFTLWVIILTSVTIKAMSLVGEIRSRPNLSKAFDIPQTDYSLEQAMSNKQYTAFIPSDDAIAEYENETLNYMDANLLKYHLVNIAYRIPNIPPLINTDLFGNPKLYVNKLPSEQPAIPSLGDFDYYINNAKVIEANITCTADEGGGPQVLHVVDRVIIAAIPNIRSITETKYINPDARTLLTNHEVFELEESLSISEFKDQVQQLNIMDSFELGDSNTFFIPINQESINMIDKDVVHSQIVPREALFTRTAQYPKERYSSYANADNMKAYIEFEEVMEVHYVKCSIAHGEIAHKDGTVLARIVHGNIPVKNGVVHLIDRPLMYIADSIKSYLEEDGEGYGQLEYFYDLFQVSYNDVFKEIPVNRNGMTLFAPANVAFEMVSDIRLKRCKISRYCLSELVKLHLVPEKITTNMMKSNSFQQLQTLNNHQKIYIDINNSTSGIPVINLDSAGVSATILTPNIPTKNGVIHIIDRILGIPYRTAYQTLKTVPMLSSTAALGAQDDWYYYLDRRDKKFTFFAPSNDAWDFIKNEMPSLHKKLFSGNFSYHVNRILEKHLKVGDAHSLSDFSIMLRNTTQVSFQMLRGKIYLQRNNGEYYVGWHDVEAKLIRPGVECVNGIIHIIDKVIMKPADVTVNASPAVITTEYFVIFSAIVVTIFC